MSNQGKYAHSYIEKKTHMKLGIYINIYIGNHLYIKI